MVTTTSTPVTCVHIYEIQINTTNVIPIFLLIFGHSFNESFYTDVMSSYRLLRTAQSGGQRSGQQRTRGRGVRTRGGRRGLRTRGGGAARGRGVARGRGAARGRGTLRGRRAARGRRGRQTRGGRTG